MFSEQLARPASLAQYANAQSIENCSSTDELAGVCAHIGEQAGFNQFCVFSSGTITSRKFSDRVMLTNWPKPLIDWLDAMIDMEAASAEVAFLRDSLPLKWDASEEDGVIATGFSDFGLQQNLMFKVQTPVSLPSIFMFSGNRHGVTILELMSLQFYANLLFNKLSSLRIAEEQSRQPQLSRREKECLRWTAMGKTSAEIGIILDLSEHTINNYLNNACRKMEATNRSHAVFMATRKGIIF